MSGSVTDNPSQRVTVTGEGGTFTLSFGGGATTELPFNATAAEVQAALREIPAIALENLYPGNVFVSRRQSRRRQSFLRSDLRRRPGRPAADDDRHLLADRTGSGRQRRPGAAATVP